MIECQPGGLLIQCFSVTIMLLIVNINSLKSSKYILTMQVQQIISCIYNSRVLAKTMMILHEKVEIEIKSMKQLIIYYFPQYLGLAETHYDPLEKHQSLASPAQMLKNQLGLLKNN